MSIKSRSTRKWMRLILVILIVGMMSYSFMASFKSYVEDKKREQARYNLQHITYCLSRVTTVVENLGGAIQCESENQLKQSIWATCTAKMRTSVTGDVYALDSKTLEFVYDNSNDIPVEKLYFTEDSIGDLFHDWDSGAHAILAMTTGNDSTASDRLSYNFDGSPEWLEWKQWEGYTIVQGTQSDEVLASMQKLEYMYYLFMLIMVMVLVLEVNSVPYEQGRRDSDGR